MEIQLHSFLTAPPDDRCMINFTPWSLYPMYTFNRKLGVSQSRFWRSEEEKNLLFIMGIEPRFLTCTTRSLATTTNELSRLHTQYLSRYEDTYYKICTCTVNRAKGAHYLPSTKKPSYASWDPGDGKSTYAAHHNKGKCGLWQPYVPVRYPSPECR